MIKGVLFDVGGTLIRVTPSVGEVYARVARRHGIPRDPDGLEAAFRSVFKDHSHQGNRIEKGWWRNVVADVFETTPELLPNRFFEELYNQFALPDVWEVIPDVKPVLEDLRSKGLKLAVASNWDERLPALLDTLGLSPHFDYKFISYEVGSQKPEKQFFDTCIEKMGIPANELLHVGDDRVNDWEGARNAGLNALLLSRQKRGPKASPGTIYSLNDVVTFQAKSAPAVIETGSPEPEKP